MCLKVGVVSSGLCVGFALPFYGVPRLSLKLPNVTFTACLVRIVQIQGSRAVYKSLVQRIRYVQKDGATQSECLTVGLLGERTGNREKS